MYHSYLMLFPAQDTAMGVVPAHLFTVRTDNERFDALAEGATDVTGNPLYESHWDHECEAGDFAADHDLEGNPYH